MSLPASDLPHTVILGGGGHARVLIESLLASGVAVPEAVLDADPSVWGREVFGVPIHGSDQRLPELQRQGVTHFVVGLGGVGDNRPRQQLFERAMAHGLQPLTVIHPTAIVSRAATIGGGSLVGPGAIVNAGAVLGVNVIVNTGAIVEHDCHVGDHVHIATGAKLSSTMRVGSLAHIGVGASVRQRLTIGEGAVVGAGAVVVKDVDPWTVVVGVPAQVLQRVERGATLGISSQEEESE